MEQTNKQYVVSWLLAGICLVGVLFVLIPFFISSQSNSQSLVPLMTETPKKPYTVDQITKHNVLADCWVIVHGKVFDATKFFAQYNTIPNAEGYCGKDDTEIFDQTIKTVVPQASSDQINQALNKYAIGVIK